MRTFILTVFPVLALAGIAVVLSIRPLHQNPLTGPLIPWWKRIHRTGFAVLIAVLALTALQLTGQVQKDRESDRQSSEMSRELKETRKELEASQQGLARIRTGDSRLDIWKVMTDGALRMIRLESKSALYNLRTSITDLELNYDAMRYGNPYNAAMKARDSHFFACVEQVRTALVETGDRYDTALAFYGVDRAKSNLRADVETHNAKTASRIASLRKVCEKQTFFPPHAKNILEYYERQNDVLYEAASLNVELEYFSRINESLPVEGQFRMAKNATTVPNTPAHRLFRDRPPIPYPPFPVISDVDQSAASSRPTN